MKEEEEEPKNKRKKGKVRKYRTTTNNTQTTPKQHPNNTQNNTQRKGWNPPLGNRKDVDVKPGSAWPVCRGSFSKLREFDLGWYSRSNSGVISISVTSGFHTFSAGLHSMSLQGLGANVRMCWPKMDRTSSSTISKQCIKDKEYPKCAGTQ